MRAVDRLILANPTSSHSSTELRNKITSYIELLYSAGKRDPDEPDCAWCRISAQNSRWPGQSIHRLLIGVYRRAAGDVIAGPFYGGEAITATDIDLSDFISSNCDLDDVGHYARPDVFSLREDATAQPNGDFHDWSFGRFRSRTSNALRNRRQLRHLPPLSRSSQLSFSAAVERSGRRLWGS